ncbi:MAG: ABC transporter permease [Gemmatimonadetes bacterium]|nr:ABC transporter permease [Gemmatimonadota bacterium]
MDILLRDFRYAIRRIAGDPGFAAITIAIMALGIGVNTAIFSIVDTVLFKPPPYRDVDRVVNIYTVGDDGFAATSSYPDILEFAGATDLFVDVTTYEMTFLSMIRPDGADAVVAEYVSANYFRTLGLEAERGRILGDVDRAPGAPPVAVVSHQTWRRRFGSDPSTVGRTLQFNGTTVTVVGVGPKGYNGSVTGFVVDFWIPITSTAPLLEERVARQLESRATRGTFVKARLQPNVSVEQAQAGLDVISDRLRSAYPETNAERSTLVMAAADVRILPFVDKFLYPVGTFLMIVVGLVLLIASSNLANLLLAKASTRQKEIAIRLALGASRRRLASQLLLESTMLSTMGGVVGVGLAYWMAKLILAFKPPIPIPIAIDLTIDVRVLTFALVLSVVTGVLFGLVPALKATKPELLPSLKDERNSIQVGGRKMSFRNLLVVGQVAVSLVLLIAAGLFVQSMRNASRIDPGFITDNVAITTLSLDMAGYAEAQSRSFYAELVERVQSSPGVQSVVLVDRLPLSAAIRTRNALVDGFELGPDEDGIPIDIVSVSPGYFVTLGVPLLRGRDFGVVDNESSPRVAIVSEAMANRFWDGDAIGRTLRLENAQDVPVTVVGVARDTKVRTLGEDPRPYLYLPHTQVFSAFVSVVARTEGDPGSTLELFRREIRAMDPNVPILETKTMPQHLGLALFAPRMGAALLSAFGILAMLLASLGLYGVVAFAVSNRTRELGIRVALGAQYGDIIKMVMRESVALVGIGVVIGLVLAAGSTFPLSRVLYGIDGLAPGTYLAVASVFFSIALLASFIPARRAAKVDPVVALRSE